MREGIAPELCYNHGSATTKERKVINDEYINLELEIMELS